MKIKAKFKGADGSLGFKNGETYPLIFQTGVSVGTVHHNKIFVECWDDVRKACVYDSLKGFLNNWQVIGG